MGAQTYWGRSYYTQRKSRTGEFFESVTTDKVAWTDSFVGVGNPYYLGQIASHTDATTGASWSRSERSCSATANSTYGDPVNPTKWSISNHMEGSFVPFVSLDTYLPTSSADARARIAFRNQVRELQTAFQGGAFLGELREALHGIKHPVQALRKGVDSLITASRKNAKLALKGHTAGKVSRSSVIHRAARDTWLEWAYDKKPLIHDVSSFADAIVRSPKLDTQGVVGRADDNTRVSVKTSTSRGYQPWNLGFDIMKTRRTSVRYLGAVKFEALSGYSNTLRKFGLDWSNVAPTIWELIPYSFLVDYFTNCGALIDASSVAGFSVVWGCRTEIQESRAFVLSAYDLPADPGIKIRSHSVSVSNYVNYNRRGSRTKFNVSDIGVNIFDLQLRMPGVTSLKWLNLAALASGRFFR